MESNVFTDSRSHIGGVLLILLVTLLTACSGSPRIAPQAEGPILIGGVLCTTGIQAPYDEPSLRGAQLAVEALNRQGGILGRQVEFVNMDGQSDPEQVRKAAAQLIDQGAVAIIAPCDFDFGSPASQEAQKAGIVGISTCASSPLYSSDILGDKQFTLSMWNTTMGAAAAEYAYVDRGWRTAYIVTDTFLSYTISLSEYFEEHFKSLGGQIVGEDTYLQGDADFTTQLARLQALPELPDVIYVSSYMPDLSLIIRTIRAAGINTPIMGGDSYDDPTFFAELGPEYGNEIYFITHSWMQPEANQYMKDFIQLYQEAYGEPPDTAFIATGWDAVMVLAQAMQHARATDGEAVARAMEEMQFELLTGRLDWSSALEGHEPNKEAALVQLQGGVPVFIGWGRPENVPRP